MPLFYFHSGHPDYVRDLDGTELPNLMAARIEAVRFAGELISENPVNISVVKTWEMEVTDHMGLLVFRLDFAVASSPAEEEEQRAAQPQ